MVAVTSRLGGFLGFRHTQTRACPALPGHALTLCAVCVSTCRRLRFISCSAPCRSDTSGRSDVENSITLPCILEAFHGARQLAVLHEETLRLLGGVLSMLMRSC